MKQFVFVSFFLLTLFAFSLTQAEAEIPDTPVGEKLKLLLETFELDTHENFIKNEFDNRFLNQFPIEDHLSFFNQVHEMHGGFEVYKIISSEDFFIEVIAKSNKRNKWRSLILEVSEKSPHNITGIGIDMAQQPADVPYTGKKHDLVSKMHPDPNAVVNGPIANKIDAHLTTLEERGFSGAVIVAQKGKILLSKGYGYADRKNKIPFQTTTAFDNGSLAKQFTGAGILKLEMMGKLSVQDSIIKYFDNVPADKQMITLHHLLTHGSGFAGGLGYDFDSISRADFIDLALNSKLLYTPGTGYEYSNVGFALLAAIIEQITGDSYEKFLNEQLFAPAGMNQTGYVLPNWSENQVAVGYRGDEVLGKPNKLNWDDDGPWWHLRGNGGIITTIGDMYKWDRALYTDDILSDAAKEKYFTPFNPEGPEGDTFYGYGWVVTKSARGTNVLMHNGGNSYFTNDCYRYLDDDVFMYIASNNGDWAAYDQSGFILRTIFQ